MKHTDDGEPLIRNVLLALLITAITIAIFLIPSPKNVEAPTGLELQSSSIIPVAEAKEVESTKYAYTEKPVLRAELVRVCSCEATGSPNNDPTLYHYEDDGVTPLIGRYNSDDRGMCQINMKAHAHDIEKKELDILNDWDDYITYTNWVYDTQGLRPWKYSKHCWQK